jgi:drug/metabolite transporter (DMT)-like permease
MLLKSKGKLLWKISSFLCRISFEGYFFAAFARSAIAIAMPFPIFPSEEHDTASIYIVYCTDIHSCSLQPDVL